jgi:hypothetical protein
MTRIAILTAAVFFTIAPKPQIRVRLNSSAALSADAAMVKNALARGLHVESLVAPDSALPAQDWTSTGASANPSRPQVTFLNGTIISRDSTIEVQMVLVDLLQRRLAGPDTVVLVRGRFGNVLEAYGRQYARRVAGK